jgi:hypothetical protein
MAHEYVGGLRPYHRFGLEVPVFENAPVLLAGIVHHPGVDTDKPFSQYQVFGGMV